MARHRSIALVGGALVVLYPFLVYWSLDILDPRVVALLLVAATGFKFVGARMPLSYRLVFAVGLAVACALTLLTGSDLGLLLYPVLINLLLFFLFLFSWWHPPSVIESLARLHEPDLPPAGIAYTRKVTLVWALFFALNGTLAALTIPMGKAWWTVYNGLIAYLLMGLLFSVEWLIRQKVKADHHAV